MTEFLDIVNDKDEVVGNASYDEVYQKKLPHRIVHIFIFNDKGEMALHLRSKQKSFCPLHWSTPVGGHVQSSETYEQAALREFKEELGTAARIEFAYKDIYITPDERKIMKFLATFNASFNGPFEINPEEVERVEFFSLQTIKNMIANGEKFHPELLFLLKKHFS